MITHRLPRVATKVELAPSPSEPFYSLFQKINGKWTRIRTTAYHLKYAVNVFGDEVFKNPLSFKLASVDITSKAEGITHFSRVHYNSFKDSPLRSR